MSRHYKEMILPPPRQNVRNIWASQVLNRRELVAPQYGEALLFAVGQKPRRARSTIVLGPLHGAAPGKLSSKPTPTLGAFSAQVLGPEVKNA